jgi:hypothetical protein
MDETFCFFLQWVLPELAGTLAMSLILVFTYHWMLFIATLPYSGILLHKLVAFCVIPIAFISIYSIVCVWVCGCVGGCLHECCVSLNEASSLERTSLYYMY